MKKVKLFFMVVFITANCMLTAQVAVNTDGSSPDSSAMLDVKSTGKGFLLPRVASVDSVSNPATGLMVFDENTKCMRFYNGAVWSACMSFSCGEGLVDLRDGKSYATVLIGTQCWMAESLNIGTMINGSSNQTNNGTIEKYCYSDNTSNCDTYGGLYLWNEMMQYLTTEGTQGICPSGWHLPTDTEWKTLEIHLGMAQSDADSLGYRGTDEGSKMAGNEPLWIDGNLDQNANFGTSGFTGLPAGYRNTNGSFTGLTIFAYFWSSNENASNAWRRGLSYDQEKVSRNSYNQAYGFSVRCVRD
jgi:uncharacterized protein (TIGR02145 family)